MAAIDDDVIDRAIMEAQSYLEAQKEEPEPEVEESDEVEEEADESNSEEPEADTEADTEEIEEEQAQPAKQSAAKPGKNVDAKGVKTKSTDSAEGNEQDAPQNAEIVEPPQFWKAEHKEAFKAAPVAVQKAIREYEEQRNRYVYNIERKAQAGEELRKQIDQVFQPHADEMRLQGINNPVEAVSRLLAWDNIFKRDPLKGIMGLMERNGITPEDLMAPDAGYQPIDPRLQQAMEAAEEAKRLAEEQKQIFETRERERYISTVNVWKQGRDQHGNPRQQFAELYAPQITQAATEIEKQYPNLPLEQILDHAYNFVRQNVQNTLGVNLAPQNNGASQAANSTGLDPKRAAQAAVSVKGAPNPTAIARQKPKARSIDEALRMAEEQLGL